MTFNVLASGMVTPVGFQAPSSCAAVRARIAGIRETRFKIDQDWMQGGTVPFPEGFQGRDKLRQMAAMAIGECISAVPPHTHHRDVSLFVCLPEKERPGGGATSKLDEGFIHEVLNATEGADALQVVEGDTWRGPAGAVEALEAADEQLHRRQTRYAIVVGVDSYLVGRTLQAYHRQERLLTPSNSDGFIPGEAAAAILVGPRRDEPDAFQCFGFGWGHEPAVRGSGQPLRARGLTEAYKNAFRQSGVSYGQIDYRMADISGEEHAFKEAALAVAATMRILKEDFELEHPTESTGRIGAATAPFLLGVALAGARKRYAPGPGVLFHLGTDDGRRAAWVAREFGKDSHPPIQRQTT